MSRAEQPVPWQASTAALREPYPRKNLYFVGDGMDEVYDYCIWQAHVDRHVTLNGTSARGTSALISDILTRTYVKTMLDLGKLDEFRAWRCAEYQIANETVRLATPDPQLLIVQKEIELASRVLDEGDKYVPVSRRYKNREELDAAYLSFVKLRRAELRKRNESES